MIPNWYWPDERVYAALKAIELQRKTHEEKKMIKSEIERSEEFFAPSYPCFMESSKYIVLLHEEGQGMVVHVKEGEKEGGYKVGSYSVNWNCNGLKPFKGEVVLTSD